MLRCQSPAMVHKELLAFLIAHNLLRWMMVQAARQYAVDVYRISFTGTLDAFRQFASAMAQAKTAKNVSNFGRKCCAHWPMIWCRNVPDAGNRGPSNEDLNRIRYSTSRDTNFAKTASHVTVNE